MRSRFVSLGSLLLLLMLNFSSTGCPGLGHALSSAATRQACAGCCSAPKEPSHCHPETPVPQSECPCHVEAPVHEDGVALAIVKPLIDALALPAPVVAFDVPVLGDQADVPEVRSGGPPRLGWWVGHGRAPPVI